MLGTFAIVAEEHSTDRCVSAACCPSSVTPSLPCTAAGRELQPLCAVPCSGREGFTQTASVLHF